VNLVHAMYTTIHASVQLHAEMPATQLLLSSAHPTIWISVFNAGVL
jgi:hypothetical protein